MVKKRRWTPSPKSRPLDRIGIAWFKPETHARMLEIMADPQSIPWNYERWREKAQTQERHWKATTNRLVVRVVIDPEKFLAWCAIRACQPNSKSLEGYTFEQTVGDEFMRKLRESRL
jgi:hypothetical protein